MRGYKLDSDDYSSIEDEYPYGDQDSSYLDDKTWDEGDEEIRRVHPGPISWIATQILPRYADQEVARSSFSRIEVFINRLSPYQEMVDATSDAEFQDILDSLKAEWRWGMNIVSLSSL